MPLVIRRGRVCVCKLGEGDRRPRTITRGSRVFLWLSRGVGGARGWGRGGMTVIGFVFGGGTSWEIILLLTAVRLVLEVWGKKYSSFGGV